MQGDGLRREAPAREFHTEKGTVVQAVLWRRNALVAFSRDVRDEGVASP